MCASNYFCDGFNLLLARVCVKMREEIVPFVLPQGLPNRYGCEGWVKLKLNSWFSLQLQVVLPSSGSFRTVGFTSEFAY